VNLGSAAFFEPDEGRNAEKAREILLLNDWVTPHENFLPVLDKPMFFYWLVALSYKISVLQNGPLDYRLSCLPSVVCFWFIISHVSGGDHGRPCGAF